MEKKHVGIVSQTHWDREWYETFQQYRYRLVDLTDFLLDILEGDPNYKHFIFDGQTVVLEDYEEIRPQNKERIKKLVAAGRLDVGPWYILPDEYIVSPEATVRNLLLGHMISAEYGRTMKAGYLPDPFGHISQMPQILNGFGIKSFIFSRGSGDEIDEVGTDCWWEAPDGSRVLAINQPHGYCNASGLGAVDGGEYFYSPRTYKFDIDLALKTLREEIDFVGKTAQTKHVLMNNGCDHQFPQPQLPAIIEAANKAFDDVEVEHTTFEKFVEAMLADNPDLKVIKKELHDARHHWVLSGVFSARMYIKQRNHETETLLERWAEPISALAEGYGQPYDRAFLWHAWRYLIKNHPHDSICGCSIDQVHAEMMPRFDQACQIGEVLVKNGVKAIAKKIDTTFENVSEGAKALLVINPIATTGHAVVQKKMKLAIDPAEKIPNMVVRGPDGNVVPFQLSNQVVRGYSSPIPGNKKAWEFDLSILADSMPGIGYRTYCMDFGEARVPSTLLEAGGSTIGNSVLRVDANPNGSLSVTDKRTGKTYENMNLYEDAEDLGDEYDYSAARNSRTLTTASASASVELTGTGPVYAELTITHNLSIPESATEDRLSRSSVMVDCPVTTRVRVYAGIPRVDIQTTVGNRAKDHRLRAIFPTDLVSSHCYADGHFDVIKRPVELPKAVNWSQKPVPTHHNRRFVDIFDGEFGLAIANEGLPEYEVREDPNGLTIALTLFRACGWLSYGDLLTRGGNAGPAMRTPEAQMQGTYTFSYSIIPHAGEWDKSGVHEQALSFVTPPKAFEVAMSAGDDPKEATWLSIEPSSLVLSALKKAERSSDYVVRLYNTTEEGVDGKVKVNLPVTHYAFASMDEEKLAGAQRQAIVDGSLEIVVPPKQIVTILLGGAE